jgi:hypothetical protein
VVEGDTLGTDVDHLAFVVVGVDRLDGRPAEFAAVRIE